MGGKSEGLFAATFHVSLSAPTLKNRQRAATTVSGKAELGLLAALALFVGGVGFVINAVVKSYRPVPVVAVDRPPKHVSEDLAKPEGLKNSGPVRTVTIVADPKAIAAVDNLKGTVKDDGKPRRRKDEAAAPPPEKVVNYAEELELDAQVLRPDSAQVEEATSVLSKYWKARTWQEKLPLVFQPEQVKPHMEAYYGAQSSRDPQFGSFVSAAEIRVSARKVVSLCYRSTGRMGGVLHADFHRAPGGVLLLDWESLVGFSDRSMRDFRTARDKTETPFRVQAVRDDYYNFEFADEKKFLSLRLYTPDGDDFVHAFCERDSPIARKLQQVLGEVHLNARSVLSSDVGGPAVNSFPITVAIAFPTHAQSDRCVRLDRFVSAWWLTSETEKAATAAVSTAAQ